MAGFLYFAKGRREPVTLQLVRDWGLGYAFESEPTDVDVIHPKLGSGKLFAEPRRHPDLALVVRDAPEQIWTLHSPVVTSSPRSEVHVGYWAEHKPTPADLSRKAMLPGHDVSMGDGLRWRSPIALQWNDSLTAPQTTALPQGAEYDATLGKWMPGQIDPRYQRLWEIANRFNDEIRRTNSDVRGAMAEEGEQVAPDDEIEISLSASDGCNDAVEALAFNYLIGPVEATLLGWFAESFDVAGEVLAATIDYPTLQRLLKKKAATGGGTS